MLDAFLKENKMTAEDIDFQEIIESFFYEMEMGLLGEMSSLQMNPSYLDVTNEIKTDENIICIDAGGTNLRIALTNIDKKGNLNVLYFKKYSIPGADKEILSDEFFETLAEYIKPIAQKSDKIGFSFAFVAKALENGDAKVMGDMCKEVKVKEIDGKIIGKELNKAFIKKGIGKKKITVINDTVAALLSGINSNEENAYIGFILGTGTNCAITTKAKYVKKIKCKNDLIIINMESGMFDKINRGYFDKVLDKKSEKPNDHVFEKMISGGYLGELISLVFSKYMKESYNFTTEEISLFLSEEKEYNAIKSLEEHEKSILKQIAQNIAYRAAKLVSINLAAAIIKSTEFTNKTDVIISAEGTTFHKFYKFRENVTNLLNEILKDKNINYKIINAKNSVIKGCTIAALLNK